MKVWIIYADYDYEDWSVEGVASSEELAKAFIMGKGPGPRGTEAFIAVECEVDGEMTGRYVLGQALLRGEASVP